MRKISTVEVLDGSRRSHPDRVIIGFQSVAHAGGGAAGEAITIPVLFGPDAALPESYTALVSPDQDATWFVSAKTAIGFTVTLIPRLATAMLAAGHIDIAVFA